MSGGGFQGGGFLSFDSDQHRYAGALELTFQDKIALKAIGLLTTRLPDGSPGFSLLIIISAEFTPIQLGLGFTLNGVGGLLGLNRTARIERLRTGVKDGTLSSILFPQNVVANADRIISDIEQVFPAMPDRFIFGPMARIGWGTPPLVIIDLGLMIEVPDPIRLIILGVVRAQLPTEGMKLLQLQVNFLGVIDFEAEQLAFDASLYDSKLLTYPLAGDMAVRLSWGADKNGLLTVGGFHPDYQPPPMALPDLRRLSLQLLSGNNPRLLLETYFAVTSNTVQFGARLELYAAAGQFNVYGFLSFDVLFQFNPFHLTASVSAMLALRIGSSTIAGITLSLTLDGPTPWHAHGTASFKLCWFITIKVRFDKTFGEERDTRLDDVAVLPLLQAALADKGNWTAELPLGRHRLVSLTQLATSGDQIVADPVGVLTISQKVVPLKIDVQRFGQQRLVDGPRFAIEQVQIGAIGDMETLEAADLEEFFAPAQFFERSDTEKLSGKSFERYDAGVRLSGMDVLDTDYAAARVVEYELFYRDSQRQQQLPHPRPEPLVLDVAAFHAWASAGAVASSPLSSAGRKKSALAPQAVAVLQEQFARGQPGGPAADRCDRCGSERGRSLRPDERDAPRQSRSGRQSPGRTGVRGEPAVSDQIATYTFLPWLRQGIAAKIRTPDTLGSGAGPADRTAVRISVRVNDIADFVSGDVQLVGPGDVVGLNPQAIVRVEPRQWATDFEPNYLAFVEFYDEDFPWRYTPARAVEANAAGVAVADARQTKLRPWIFLMVLEEEEFEPDAAPQGPLATIRLRDTVDPSDLLPPPAQAWAWAHVHVNRDISAPAIAATVDALQEVARGNPDAVFSRLVCPRKLTPLTGYHALLIPAFEVGRLAGLGQQTTGQDSLAPSWGAGQREYPVYYRWYFRTGERGDFEYLVNLLEPRPADERVGVRDMDMQEPKFGVVGMRDGPGEVPIMGLEGALRSPTSRSRPALWPATSPAERPEFLRQLEQQVNLQDTLLNPPDPGTAHPDPVISPPLYGRWHARQDTPEVGEAGWVNELNQDPRYRVPAGCGTQAIQTGQEDYMQRAWQQLGDLQRVNQRIRWGQLAVAASQRMFVRHLRPLPSDQRIAITRQVHAPRTGQPDHSSSSSCRRPGCRKRRSAPPSARYPARAARSCARRYRRVAGNPRM